MTRIKRALEVIENDANNSAGTPANCYRTAD